MDNKLVVPEVRGDSCEGCCWVSRLSHLRGAATFCSAYKETGEFPCVVDNIIIEDTPEAKQEYIYAFEPKFY